MAELHLGDNMEVMAGMADESVDSIVTDPPAGISFMQKDWDSDKGGRDIWIDWMAKAAKECLRILKPGGHALVWALPRTSHWTGMAWENAGFQVRDIIHHCFGSGFPKSQDVSKFIDKLPVAERKVIGVKPGDRYKYAFTSDFNPESPGSRLGSGDAAALTAPATDAAKQWDGWGTALKPAVEEWWLFRKPLAAKTVAANVLQYGTGALNIDGCRIETTDNLNGGAYAATGVERNDGWGMQRAGAGEFRQPEGRWPANVIHDGSDEVLECFPSTAPSRKGKPRGSKEPGDGWGMTQTGAEYDDSGSAARFFYCAKASKKDRGEGNQHVTVKPTSLMQYLCRLITPPGGIVFDPYMGSGSTGKAAILEGFQFIGIEQDPESYLIAMERIEEVERGIRFPDG